MGILELVILAVLLLIPLWKIFERAGFAPALSLLVLVPGVGGLITLAILAFGDWRAHSHDAASGKGGYS
jgi:hypothetical protein